MEEPSDLKEGKPLSSQSGNGTVRLNRGQNCRHEIKHFFVVVVLSFFSFFFFKTHSQVKLANLNLWDAFCRKQLIQHLTLIHDSALPFLIFLLLLFFFAGHMKRKHGDSGSHHSFFFFHFL